MTIASSSQSHDLTNTMNIGTLSLSKHKLFLKCVLDVQITFKCSTSFYRWQNLRFIFFVSRLLFQFMLASNWGRVLNNSLYMFLIILQLVLLRTGQGHSEQ